MPSFWIRSIKNLLDFCNYCNSIGLHVGICRRAKVNVTSYEGENAAKDDNFIKRPGKESFKEPTKDIVQHKRQKAIPSQSGR